MRDAHFLDVKYVMELGLLRLTKAEHLFLI
jgi:hypothetical protein